MAYGREKIGVSENRMQKNSLLDNSLQIVGGHEPPPDVLRFHVCAGAVGEFGEIGGRLSDWNGEEGLETGEMICIDGAKVNE